LQVKGRADMALEKPAFIAAYILDHRYRGVGLSTKQMLLGRKFICEANGACSVALSSSLAQEEPFAKELFGEEVLWFSFCRSPCRFPQGVTLHWVESGCCVWLPDRAQGSCNEVALLSTKFSWAGATIFNAGLHVWDFAWALGARASG